MKAAAAAKAAAAEKVEAVAIVAETKSTKVTVATAPLTPAERRKLKNTKIATDAKKPAAPKEPVGEKKEPVEAKTKTEERPKTFLLVKDSPAKGKYQYNEIVDGKIPENSRPLQSFEKKDFNPPTAAEGATLVTAVKAIRKPKKVAFEFPDRGRAIPIGVKAPSAVSKRSRLDDRSGESDSLRDSPTRMLDRIGHVLIKSMKKKGSKGVRGYQTPHLSLTLVGDGILIAGNTPVTRAQADGAAATLKGLTDLSPTTSSGRKIRALLNGDYQHQHQGLLDELAKAEKDARAELRAKSAAAAKSVDTKVVAVKDEGGLAAEKEKEKEKNAEQAATAEELRKDAEHAVRVRDFLGRFEVIRLAIVQGRLQWKPAPATAAPAKGTLHGEMRILEDVKTAMQKSKNTSGVLKDWPVGGVKRDCLACHRAFAIFNEGVAQPCGYRVTTAGTHSKLYPGWLAPDWLQVIPRWEVLMTTPALPGWSFTEGVLKSKTKPAIADESKSDPGYESESDEEEL